MRIAGIKVEIAEKSCRNCPYIHTLSLSGVSETPTHWMYSAGFRVVHLVPDMQQCFAFPTQEYTIVYENIPYEPQNTQLFV